MPAAVSQRHFDLAADLYPSYPRGFPYENFDIKQVALPPGDNMGIPSDDEDMKEDDVEAESGFGSVIGRCAGGRAARRSTTALLLALAINNIEILLVRPCVLQSSATSPSCHKRSMRSSRAW